MTSQRPFFFSTFFSAIRQQQPPHQQPNKATSSSSAAASSSSGATANATAQTTATTSSSATTTAPTSPLPSPSTPARAIPPPTHAPQHSQSRSPGSVLSPRPAIPIPGASSRRRGSDSSSEGFRDVLGADKWYVGGRTANGEERYFKLGVIKRVRSSDGFSIDKLSL